LVPEGNGQLESEVGKSIRQLSTVIRSVGESISEVERLQRGLMQRLLAGRTRPDGSVRDIKDFIEDRTFGVIPKDWRSCRFKDLLREGVLLEIQDGNHGEKHPTQDDYVKDGIPFIMACDISSGRLDLKNAKKISPKVADGLRIGSAITDDVLLSHKASIGFTAVVGKVDPYIVLTPQVTYYRCDKNKLDPRFVHYYFRTYRFQKTLEVLSTQSTRSYIGITDQKKLPILFPTDIREQRMISERLGITDALIDVKREKIDAIAQFRTSLVQNLLTGRIHLPFSELQVAGFKA
jgi:type I restriction enzyme S subunit